MSSGTTEDAKYRTDDTKKAIKCEMCDKEFRTQWELSSHKDIEHIRHLALAGVS